MMFYFAWKGSNKFTFLHADNVQSIISDIDTRYIMPLSNYGCMQPACSLHVDRLPVVDAVQPSANALQAIDIRGFADRHASY
jgi:hypothetical protein